MRKNKFYICNKIRFICCCLFILFIMICPILMKINISSNNHELEYVQMYIKSGDTLWDVAKKFTSKDRDIRKTIYEISIINNLDTLDIYPGQIIKIPIKKK